MKKYHTVAFTCGFVALGLVCATMHIRAAQPETELAGRIVSMEIVRVEDFETASWPSEDITLVAETVVIKPGETIFKLLEQRGIRSDTEALTLIYDLNPTIEKLEPLTPNTSLSLPKVVGGSQLRQLLQSGHVVALTVDLQEFVNFFGPNRLIRECTETDLREFYQILCFRRSLNRNSAGAFIGRIQGMLKAAQRSKPDLVNWLRRFG